MACHIDQITFVVVEVAVAFAHIEFVAEDIVVAVEATAVAFLDPVEDIVA
jgi:hypothetical protein